VHGLAIVAVRDGRVHEANGSAGRLFTGLRIGMAVEELFEASCQPKARELLSKDVPTTAELEVKQAGHPLDICFLLVPAPDERLLIAAARGVSYAEKMGARLMAANSELAMLTRELSQRVHELDTERAWLQNIIDQMPDGILLYDERGRLKATNRAFRALGCDQAGRTDPYGNPVILDAREPDGHIVPFDELPIALALRDQQAIVRKELLLRQNDGRLIPVSMSAVPVQDADGKLSGVTMMIEDISERKELERLREEWAAIVAHDLRQPASTISLGAESLLAMHSVEWTERERRALARICSASGRLNRMISDLTDASRIESKRLSIAPRPVELRAFIESVVESLDEVVDGHAVHLTIEGEPLVWIDPDRVHQVLANLVTNAAKYGDPNTAIAIDVAPRGELVELLVTNHGPGIPPEQMPLLFSRFARTPAARASRAPGLGLGLYIAKGLVEAHGGSLWAESVPGKTTTFHVTLPTTGQPAQPRAEAECTALESGHAPAAPR
jgi:signal transduction histidine kinase